MPDLLGPNPCADCEELTNGFCTRSNGKARAVYHFDACGPYAAYAAKLELLEALKAGGVKTTRIPLYFAKDAACAGEGWADSETPCWVIVIPEAQP